MAPAVKRIPRRPPSAEFHAHAVPNVPEHESWETDVIAANASQSQTHASLSIADRDVDDDDGALPQPRRSGIEPCKVYMAPSHGMHKRSLVDEHICPHELHKRSKVYMAEPSPPVPITSRSPTFLELLAHSVPAPPLPTYDDDQLAAIPVKAPPFFKRRRKDKIHILSDEGQRVRRVPGSRGRGATSALRQGNTQDGGDGPDFQDIEDLLRDVEPGWEGHVLAGNVEHW